MAAIDPREVMEAGAGGDPGSWTAPVGAFTPGSPAANTAGMAHLGPKPPAEVKTMLAAAGYAGERIVLLHPADSPTNDAMFQVIARRLADAGMNVDDQIMDSATVAMRRIRREPPDKGGWSLFITNAPGAGHVSPMVAQGYRTGAAAAPGWPTNPEVETLREQWIDAADEAEQRRLTARIQEIVLDDCIEIPLGLHVRKSAWRANVTGILTAPEPVMWNLAKR